LIIKSIKNGEISMDFKFIANKYVIELIENKKWLDLACGSGELLEKASQREIIGDGLDLKKGKYCKYVHDLEEKIPIKDNYYEQASCIDSMEHIGNLTLLFSEVNRILKKNGTFIFSVPNTKRYHHHNHISAFTYKSIKNLINNSGFTVIAEIFFYYIPYLKIAVRVPTSKLASHFIFKTKKK